VDLAVVWSAAAPAIAEHMRRSGVPTVLAAPPLPAAPERIAAYMLRCLDPLGLPPGPLALPLLPIDEAAWQATEKAWDGMVAHGGGGSAVPVGLLHAGAGSPNKRWPLPSFLELAATLRQAGWAVGWTCGPADEDVRQALAVARVPAETILWGYALPALCALVARASVVVAADSGVAHLAAAVGVPVVVLFGPTDERVWAPAGHRVAVLRHAACRRPEGLRSSASCPPGACCLRDLPVARVARTLQALLAATP
jgi:ADP-heptose:LPS heptosyltransferase